jgi:autotransporter-associated beta strand protein
LNAANSIGTASGTLTINSNYSLGANKNTNFRGGTVIINGVISGTGTSGVVLASGAFGLTSGTLTLAGNNTFAGNTSVASGYTLSLQHANALGATGGTNTVSSGGTMQVAGGVTIGSGESVSIAGDGVSFIGALRAGTGGGTWSGGVTMTAAARLGATAGNTLTVTGAIGGAFALGISGQSGTGVVVLNPTASNTYTGNTNIIRGILRLGKTDALPTGTTLDVDSANGVADAAIFDMASFSQTVAALQDSATTSIGGKITNSVAATTSTLTVNQASTTDFGGVIENGSGTVALTKLGTGTLTLSGANTYSGDTRFGTSVGTSTGILRLANSSALGTSKLFINNGDMDTGTVELTGGITIANNVDFYGRFSGSTGAIIRNLSGTNTLSGILTGGINGNSYNFESATGSTLNITNKITTDSGLARSLTLNGGGAINISGIIEDGTGTMSVRTFTGGGVYTLSNVNTYTGSTTVNIGILNIANNGALGTTAGEATVTSSAAALVLANGVTVTGETISIAGSGSTAGTGANFNGALQAAASATAEWAGTVKINSADARVGAGTGGSLMISGAIVDNAGFNVLNVGAGAGGTGEVIVSAASGTNTYTGNTTITRGTLKLGADNTLPTGTTLDIDTGNAAENSIFDLNGFNQTVGGLQRTNTGGGAGGAIITNSGAADKTLTINQSATTTFNGIIQDGPTNKVIIDKDGTGSLTLTGPNTYTGTTTVSEGTLGAAGANALGGTVDVAVNTGGTLLLSNTATTGRINDAATVNLAGGTVAFAGDVSETTTLGTTAGTGALTLTLDSVIDFASGNAVINFGASNLASWMAGETLSIWNWDGLVTGGGNDRLIFGIDSTALTSGQLGQISFYSGAGTGFLGTGGFVGSVGEIVPVPEPSSVATVMGLLGLVGWRERRKAQSARRATRK